MRGRGNGGDATPLFRLFNDLIDSGFVGPSDGEYSVFKLVADVRLLEFANNHESFSGVKSRQVVSDLVNSGPRHGLQPKKARRLGKANRVNRSASPTYRRTACAYLHLGAPMSYRTQVTVAIELAP